jgi:23S rRNA (cytosine1962-C5)-methyltransferase
VDTSIEALELGEQNLNLNGLDCAAGIHDSAQSRSEHIAGDVFQVLRQWRADGRRFHVVVLDPPKFAQNQRNVQAALRGYKDINLLALQLLHAEGILATFSCSGLVAPDLFQKVVFGAAVDAGRPVQVLEWLHQASDHPVAITFPEGAYLKGLICRVGQS